jgi:hypothetical protein
MDYPLLVFAISFLGLSLSAWIGKSFSKRQQTLPSEAAEGFSVVQAATLTLLGLIIGFTFSMALGRYDQRKNCEAAEANAVGTEYLRVDLLPAADAAKLRVLLLDYLDQRVFFYDTRDVQRLLQIEALNAKLQAELWSAVHTPAIEQAGPVAALAVAGMNDVLNSQGYTQAAWWNRIPTAAWILMAAIAICSNVLIGFKTRSNRPVLLLILPFVISIAFLLIADIDEPRGGLIRMIPRNLINLSQSLHTSSSPGTWMPRD